MRHENKFVFPESFLGVIEHRLLSSRFFFSEIFYERRVNNIYLDSPDYRNLYDNLCGVQNRVKHRIRWYGASRNVADPILEFKIKHGEMGFKEYAPLPSFSFDSDYYYDTYLAVIAAGIRDESPAQQLMLHDIFNEVPTLYNTYLRRYYLSADGKFRITIDRELEYAAISRWYSGLSGFSEDNIVVELKYENADMGAAARIIQELGLRLARNSKYVIGMQGLYFNNFQ